LAAAEDEVSTAIAALFSSHGESFQVLSAQAAAFHDQFVQNLSAGAQSYVSAEPPIFRRSAPIRPQTMGRSGYRDHAPSLAFTGRPLIGNGVNSAPGTGQNGAAGGWLIRQRCAGGSGAAAKTAVTRGAG